MFWCTVMLLGTGWLAPSIGLLALSEGDSLAVVANVETIYSASIWGLLIGLALVIAGAIGVVRGGK